jgi:hypothetical protein
LEQNEALLPRANFGFWVKAGKLKKVALTAVMRKLLICLNARLRKLADQPPSPEGLCLAKP